MRERREWGGGFGEKEGTRAVDVATKQVADKDFAVCCGVLQCVAV